MPALFEDMIKCTQNDLGLPDSSEKLTFEKKPHCFYIMNRFQQVLKLIVSVFGTQVL